MRLKGENKGQRTCLVGSSDSLLPGLHDDVTLNCLAWVPRSEYASLACLNSKFNSLIKSRYLDGFRKQMKIADYYVFLVCDVMHWQAFDTTRRKWTALPKIPCDECFELSDKESLTVGNELLVFGRELFNFAIWKYSLVSGDWIKCQSMNFPRCLFASGSFGSITIVAGGSDMHGSILNSVECYDTESGTWELLPSMHSPRKMCSGFVMDGKFYIMGGISTPNPPLPGTSNSTVPLTCGEEYNLQTKKWRKIEGMYPNGTGASQAPPLLAVVDNQLYAAEHRTNTVKKYDKEKNSWNVLGKLPVRADFANGWGLAFKACGNQLLVVGGQRSPEGAGLVLYTCSPNSSFNGGELQWKVLDMTENVGIFVYNCAVMGC